MDFSYSPKVQELQARVRDFIERYVLPSAAEYQREIEEGSTCPSVMNDLKSLARSENFWNLFLPGLRQDEPGTRLTNVEYTPLAHAGDWRPAGRAETDCSAAHAVRLFFRNQARRSHS